jgi:ADP-heptose:LPS heptosyltransferase
MKSALIARASGAGRRYGFDRAAVREKPAALFYTDRVGVDRSRHVVDWNLELAKHVTGNRQPATVNWPAFPREGGELAKYRGRIVLLPGAGRVEKLWPVEKFREVARAVGARALAVWGPGEKERAAAIGAELAPPTDLRQLAFLLQHASAVVGGDTGPLHLADALGAPVVGLYGPTDPRRNGPYGQLDSCISEFGRSGSMAAIAPDAVIRKIEEVSR